MGSNRSSPTKRGNIIKFENSPFDQGSIRYCFKGKVVSGTDRGNFAVIKVFKHKPIRGQYVNALQELKVYSIANDYARRFSQLLIKKGYNRTISFPEPDLVRIDDLTLWNSLTSSYFSKGDYICAQKYLRGKYVKFTNNAGFTNGREIMECFQHYTFVLSGYQAICCDLQGIVTQDKYILTDPAVNSRQRRFGNTDMGIQGMKLTLGRHKCNKICKDLGLEDNVNYNKHLKPVYNSTSKRRSHTSGI